jgi:hypothetical protein
MTNQILSEEFRRMQKLAGILTESQLEETEVKDAASNSRILSEGNVMEKEFWKDLKSKYDLDNSMATMSFGPDGITLKPKDYQVWADKYTKGQKLSGKENLVDTKAKQMAAYINKRYGDNAKG